MALIPGSDSLSILINILFVGYTGLHWATLGYTGNFLCLEVVQLKNVKRSLFDAFSAVDKPYAYGYRSLR